MPTPTHAPVELTRLLREFSAGNKAALEHFTPIVHAELHRIARHAMQRERGEHVLQPTALVNEAYLRLLGRAPVEWKCRSDFFAFSAQLMRQILVDFAREQLTAKRGARIPRVNLSAADRQKVARVPDNADLIDLDNALNELAALDSRQALVVELRYFGGLTLQEVAHAVGVSEPTVTRDWRNARAWLYSRLLASPLNAAG